MEHEIGQTTPAIDPEIIDNPRHVRPASPSRQYLPPSANPRQKTAFSAVGGFFVQYYTMIGHLAKPIPSTVPFEGAENSVSLPHVEAVWKRLEETHEVCGSLVNGIEQALKDVKAERDRLYHIQKSRIRSSVCGDFDSRLRQANALIKTLYDLTRTTLSLEVLWQKRPGYLHPSKDFMGDVSGQSFTLNAKVRHDLPPAVRHRFTDCHFHGADMSGQSYSGAEFRGCTFRNQTILVENSEAIQHHQRRAWKAFGEEVGHARMPRLVGHRSSTEVPQNFLSLQNEGLRLVEGEDLPKIVFSIDNSVAERCTLIRTEITVSGVVAQNIRITKSKMDHVTFRGQFCQLHLAHMSTCKSVHFIDTELESLHMEDLSMQDLFIKKSKLKDVDFNDVHVRGGALQDVSFLGGQAQNVTLENVTLSGRIHFDLVCCSLTLKNPTIKEGTIFSGVADGLTIDEAGDELQNLSISSLTIKNLKITNTTTIQFADRADMSAEIERGTLMIGKDPDDLNPINSADPSGVVSCRMRGKRFYRYGNDTESCVEARAEEVYEAVLADPRAWADDLRRLSAGAPRNELAVAEFFAELGFLPLSTHHLKALSDQAGEVPKTRITTLGKTAIQRLRSGEDQETILADLMQSLKDDGYNEASLQDIPCDIARTIADTLDAHASEVAQHEAFLMFCDEYSGTEEEFPSTAKRFLSANYPHLLPVRPEFFASVYRDNEARKQSKTKDPLDIEVEYLDRIQRVATEKIAAVRALGLDSQSTEDQVLYWERWRDRKLEEMEVDEYDDEVSEDMGGLT